MLSKLDIPLHGPSVNIVRKCGPALCDVLASKFGCVATIDGVDFERPQSIAQQKGSTVAPEKRFGVTLPSGVVVSVWKADLTAFPVNAIVNAANENLQHYGGLALALSNAGGPQIQKESDDYTSRYGKLKTGDAVVLDAWSLPCDKIIHAVGPQLPKRPTKSNVNASEPLLKKAIISILDRVKQKRLKSVAIPAISSGLFNYPLRECAGTIVTAVKRYYENSSGHHPKEIMFVNNDELTVSEMERACRHILGPSHSQAAGRKGKGESKTSTPTVEIGNVQLTLLRGRIEDQQTDVIVNTTYDINLSSGLISKALLQRAGFQMQMEMDIAPRQGHIVITKPYNLRCREVFHTFCGKRGRDGPQKILERSVLECLWMAVKNDHVSIAFPAIGTGGLGFQKRDVAQIMLNTVADFALMPQRKMEVYFVIFPTDDDTYKAFEEQMRVLQNKPRETSVEPGPQRKKLPLELYVEALTYSGDFQASCRPTPHISLKGNSEVAIREAERWLQDYLGSHGTVCILNNFVLHFGEQEHVQLSSLMKQGVKMEEFFDRGRSSILVHGDSHEDVAVAGLQVEAMLCNIQREFVRDEESAMYLISTTDVTFERKEIAQYTPENTDRVAAFKNTQLQIVKVESVENTSLTTLFDLKKKQLSSSTCRRMFQRIPAQFCEMVCRIGFHAECAPPVDPAYGEGIYFAGSVKKAMEVWKDTYKEYLYFVEAEVLTGNSAPGKGGLILPPALPTDSDMMYDSVKGGADIAVIFSGYQALPKYIITCKAKGK